MSCVEMPCGCYTLKLVFKYNIHVENKEILFWHKLQDISSKNKYLSYVHK
jgi:hypothetical protein